MRKTLAKVTFASATTLHIGSKVIVLLLFIRHVEIQPDTPSYIHFAVGMRWRHLCVAHG